MATAISGISPRSFYNVRPELLSLPDALALGGDRRIVIDPVTGCNSYGCAGLADANLVRFGSSTASTIGNAGYQAAGLLLDQLDLDASGAFRRDVAAVEAGRIRRELLHLAGVGPKAGVEAVLAASGTDAHLIFAQLTLHRPGAPWLVIMPDPAESGSGVPAALAGRHFATEAALGFTNRKGDAVSDRQPARTLCYAVRDADGSARSLALIDADIERAIAEAIAAGLRVLLVAVDVSKTGIVAPSPGSVIAWKRAHGEKVEVLVDACQFRLSPGRLAHYLAGNCAVAVTGSKFMGGPIFSGALLLPRDVADVLRTVAAPPALAHYSARQDWPDNWRAADALDIPFNVGLLLRWEAALAEMRRFRAVPESAARAIVEDFRYMVLRAMHRTVGIEPVLDTVDPAALGEGVTEDVATIFPFYLLLRDGTGQRRATLEEARQVYRKMPLVKGKGSSFRSRFELGQPVVMAHGEGALRLSISAPLIAEAQFRARGHLGDLVSEALAKAAAMALAIL